MRSLRLENFRSFVDTGRVELRPLTILVGANGSGKSSFLRFFPLLRQTHEKQGPSPLAWFGRYVDFGDFSQTVHRGAEPREMTVELEQHIESSQPSTASLPWILPTRIVSSTTLSEQDGSAGVRSYVLARDGTLARFAFESSGELSSLFVGTKGALEREESLNVNATGTLVPLPSNEGWFGGQLYTYVRRVRESLMRLVGDNLTSETIEELSRRLPCGDGDEWLVAVDRLRGGAALSKVLRGNPSAVQQLSSLVWTSWLPSLLRRVESRLTEIASRTVYVGPFRVIPERYYRVQDAPVGFIEHQGENLAMFLRSLSPEQTASFSAFAQEHLGFRARLDTDAGHVSVVLENDVGGAFNLIDMGYGFSQVLPIVAQCWATASGRQASLRDPLPSLIAIEQPELHLHPHHQAKLADMFVGTARAARKAVPDTRLLIETHSDALVSRLGELVELGEVASEDVVVLLFEQDPVTKVTTIRESTFSPDGTLTNWPIGFFAP